MMNSLLLTQGIDGGFCWPVYDGSIPADLTGYTVKSQVRNKEKIEAPILFEFTCGVNNSYVYIAWTAEQSLLWDWTGDAYCDVILVWPDGRPRQVIWQGMVRVDRVVTHV